MYICTYIYIYIYTHQNNFGGAPEVAAMSGSGRDAAPGAASRRLAAGDPDRRAAASRGCLLFGGCAGHSHARSETVCDK